MRPTGQIANGQRAKFRPRAPARLWPFGPFSFGYFIVAAALLLATSAAAAQPLPVDPEVALADVVKSYRGGLTSERIIVSVGKVQGGVEGAAQSAAGLNLWQRQRPPEKRDTVILRIRPGRRNDRADARVVMELGELRAFIGDRALVAMHVRNPAAYYRAAFREPMTTAAISTIMPPVPLPQLDLAFGPAGTPAKLTPYAERIQWSTATVDDQQNPQRVLITGRSATGAVALITGAKSGRVVEFACDISEPDETGARQVLSLSVLPADTAEESWTPLLADREPVDSLRDLAPKPGDLRPGRVVAGFSLLTLNNRPWTLAGAFTTGTAADAQPIGPPEAVILLMWRETRDHEPGGADPPGLQAARAAITELDRRMPIGDARELKPGEVPIFRVWPVLVTDLGAGQLPRRVAAASRTWGTWATEVLWTASPATTMDRFAPDAGAAVIVIGRDRKLRGVILPTETSTAVSVREELERLLLPKP